MGVLTGNTLGTIGTFGTLYYFLEETPRNAAAMYYVTAAGSDD